MVDPGEAIDIAEIRRLSVDERIRLVQLIWDTIEAEPEPPGLTAAQQSEVARRIADHERDPSTAIRPSRRSRSCGNATVDPPAEVRHA
jgi:putative addiction module component (TIGR02574 family)